MSIIKSAYFQFDGDHVGHWFWARVLWLFQSGPDVASTKQTALYFTVFIGECRYLGFSQIHNMSACIKAAMICYVVYTV